VPGSIVSDRDSKFNSKFWRELHRIMGTKLLMSTVFHPQTDGLTERVNRSVSQVLRAMIRPDQTDWAEQLLLAEFAMNSCTSETTGFSPFELNYGFTPRTVNLSMMPAAPDGVKMFAEKAHSNLEQAHDAIISARVRQTHYANK
jgi:transposase InsO family protein